MFWPSPTSMAEGAVGREQPGWENVSLVLEEADGKGLVPAKTDPGPGEHPLPILEVPGFGQVSSDEVGMSWDKVEGTLALDAVPSLPHRPCWESPLCLGGGWVLTDLKTWIIPGVVDEDFSVNVQFLFPRFLCPWFKIK